jgi:hypothetical protein
MRSAFHNSNFVFIFLLLISIETANGQTKYVWNDLLKKMSSDTSVLSIREKDSIILGKYWPPDFGKTSGQFENGRLVVNRVIYLKNPSLTDEQSVPLVMKDLHFKKSVYISLENRLLYILNCHFEKGVSIRVTKGNGRYILFSMCNVRGQFMLAASDYSEVNLDENSFTYDSKIIPFVKVTGIHKTTIAYWEQVYDTMKIYGNQIFGIDHSFAINIADCGKITISNNDFPYISSQGIIFNVNADYAEINKNTFGTNLILEGLIKTGFTLYQNTFNRLVALNGLTLPSHCEIEWQDVAGKLAASADTVLSFRNIPSKFIYSFTKERPAADSTYSEENIRVRFLFSGGTKDALRNKKRFKQITELHKILYDGYKLKGDLESSNGCFVEIKDMEGTRLAAIYEDRGGFKNYFGWKLNRLMKFYTNHATEPALALVISVYIILGFSILYFFFPSEWDIESKSKLVSHYKDFIQKNEKGYVKPFIKMALGFLISFLNALTLSLNAFVTLGFGNIPTMGFARYVCILQGFIGWFLLSIFTVSLFNQVLF